MVEKTIQFVAQRKGGRVPPGRHFFQALERDRLQVRRDLGIEQARADWLRASHQEQRVQGRFTLKGRAASGQLV